MQHLKENILNIFGEEGQRWLDRLPSIIEDLECHWKIKQLQPVKNMTFNYVAKGIAPDDKPIVLKIGCSKDEVLDEKNALIHFAGFTSIRLIDYNEEYCALLLEQAIPGVSLKSLYPTKLDYVIEQYTAVMQGLHAKDIPQDKIFAHVSRWLKAFDQALSDKIPTPILHKAKQLKNHLLATSSDERVLHGDLHHDNILKDQDHWLAIDPKGIIGEPTFEAAAFDFMQHAELKDTPHFHEKFAKRLNLLADKAHLDRKRLQDWVFVRLVLSAIWSIDDNCNPAFALRLADKLMTNNYL